MSSGPDQYEHLIRDLVDHPEPGVTFKDITPLLGSPDALPAVVDAMIEPYEATEIDRVVGIEARGFILATPIALRFGSGFVPVRKPGKLPAAVHGIDYDLEYGTDRLEMHTDAVNPGDRVLIVDDVLATGGTAAAAAALVTLGGASVVGFAFMMELDFLKGRDRLGSIPVESVYHWDGS